VKRELVDLGIYTSQGKINKEVFFKYITREN
jgi:hypothetical protein